MKTQKRKWSRAEIFLFAFPVLLLLLFWVFNLSKAPLQRRLAALSPTPTNTPVPTPTTPAKIREARFIYHVAPSPDGRSLWTLNKLDGKASIHQYAIEAGSWMRAIGNGVQIWGTALQVSPNAKTLVYGWSGHEGEYAEIFDARTGKSRLRLPEGSATPSVAISADSRFFALGFDGYFEIRSLKDAHLIQRIHWQSGKKTEFLEGACFSRDGKSFAVSDGTIGVFSTQSWRPVARYRPPHSKITTFAFAGKNQLAVRCWDTRMARNPSELWLYNFQSRNGRRIWTLDTGGGYDLAVSPDEKFVAISDFRTEQGVTVGNTFTQTESPGLIVQIFDVKLGTKIAAGEIEGENMIPSIAFSTDSQTLFMGCENARIRRWHKSDWNLNYPNLL